MAAFDPPAAIPRPEPKLSRDVAPTIVHPQSPSAGKGTSAQGRIEFNDFAKVWLKLATEFEKDNALLDMWSGPENGPHEAWPRRVA